MKKLAIFSIGALLSSALFTSCLEETFPTSSVTEGQLSTSTKAADATLAGMSAQTLKWNVLGRDFHYDWGIGSIMHIRDVQTGDLAVGNSNYDQYFRYQTNEYMGPDYTFMQVIWNTFYKMILTTNSAVGAFPAETDNTAMLGYRGQALAFRASMYLDAARMYEFLANDAISGVNADGNDVTGLTIPIVTDKTSQEIAGDNPRAKHEDMFNFILADLDEAEQIIGYADQSDVTKPSLGVVYGLKARLYMWNEDYAKAAEYARKAIDLGKYSPVTQSQWLDLTTGFNTPNQAWMWASQYTKEDAAVKTGIVNWVSWTSNETSYGYASAGPFNMISAELYDHIGDTDFRKLSFKAPENSPLSGQEPYIDADLFASFPTYAGLKFRPGNGNPYTSSEGNVVAIPLMRIEEMYLIEAEAVAHTNPAGAKTLLETFVQTRDPEYVCEASTVDEVVEECFQQKRIELWCEGQIFFDYKRLNHSVTRAYEGTNFQPAVRFNTNGRPAWMNTCITRQETQNNLAIEGWNNPDPTDAYTVVQ